MTAFATAADLATRMGLTFTDAEVARATALLTEATGLIQDCLDGQLLTLVTDDELTLPGTNDDRIALPQRPVMSVSSVTLDGQAITGWHVEGNELVRNHYRTILDGGDVDYGLGGLLQGAGGFGFGWPTRTLVITYTHGYATAPTLAKNICLEAALRAFVNPGAVIQETVAGTQTSYAPYTDPPRGLLLTDKDQRDLRRRFGRTTGTITVGG